MVERFCTLPSLVVAAHVLPSRRLDYSHCLVRGPVMRAAVARAWLIVTNPMHHRLALQSASSSTSLRSATCCLPSSGGQQPAARRGRFWSGTTQPSTSACSTRSFAGCRCPRCLRPPCCAPSSSSACYFRSTCPVTDRQLHSRHYTTDQHQHSHTHHNHNHLQSISVVPGCT
jgi:hypothetical protein